MLDRHPTLSKLNFLVSLLIPKKVLRTWPRATYATKANKVPKSKSFHLRI